MSRKGDWKLACSSANRTLFPRRIDCTCAFCATISRIPSVHGIGWRENSRMIVSVSEIAEVDLVAVLRDVGVVLMTCEDADEAILATSLAMPSLAMASLAMASLTTSPLTTPPATSLYWKERRTDKGTVRHSSEDEKDNDIISTSIE